MALLPSSDFESARNLALKMLKSLKADYLGVEHIFLALLEDEKPAAFFKNLNIDIEKIKENIVSLTLSGDMTPTEIKVTPRYKIIFKNAQDIAENEKSNKVEIKHFIKAVFEDENSLPSVILENNKIDKAVILNNIAGFEIKPLTGPSLKKKSFSGDDKKKLFIEKFGKDLVEQAKNGLIDPVIGREEEIERIKQILLRKTKNNPVLIGEAGVGKTAVVMGVALAVAAGNVPKELKNKRIIELNLNSVLAGAAHRGDFEERLEKIIDEVENNKKIILFIDELHNMVGTGKGAGTDAGNILKPALAKGDFPVIGATTTDEYRKYIEIDAALERRFQPVIINEPSEGEAIEILRGLKERFQVHHNVQFDDDAIIEAVRLSTRYLPGRNLPDKAIDLIDEAAAKVKIEETSGNKVTKEMIAKVLSSWTGIPVAKMSSKTAKDLLILEDELKKEVVGQDNAVKLISETVRVAYSGLADYKKPLGVFLFLGPTGVGKTYLAKKLANILFSSEKDLIRLDMSEFMEKHSVAKLIGAPPGYVGYGEEGILTKSVRTRPYSVILLDEIEKAHPEIFDIFLSLFDEGRLTDARGRTVNFCNTIIIMTSNIGSTRIDADGNIILPDMENEVTKNDIMKAVRKTFRAEFINRINETIFFKSLNELNMKKIIELNLKQVKERLREKKIDWKISDEVLELIYKQGYNPAYGARPLDRAISTIIVKPLSAELLNEKFKEGDVIKITLNKEGQVEFLVGTRD